MARASGLGPTGRLTPQALRAWSGFPRERASPGRPAVPGLAARRPTRALVLGGAVFLAATVAWRPEWPHDWLANVSRLRHHPTPLTMPFGVVLLLALARWRRPEARLIVVLACVPQLLFWSDQLPLLLVPRTLRQSLWCCAISSASVAAAALATAHGSTGSLASGPISDALVRHAPVPVMLGMYLPALVLVLRRPNDCRVIKFLPTSDRCSIKYHSTS